MPDLTSVFKHEGQVHTHLCKSCVCYVTKCGLGYSTKVWGCSTRGYWLPWRISDIYIYMYMYYIYIYVLYICIIYICIIYICIIYIYIHRISIYINTYIIDLFDWVMNRNMKQTNERYFLYFPVLKFHGSAILWILDTVNQKWFIHRLETM